jgi:ketol-acid reductoisomerase
MQQRYERHVAEEMARHIAELGDGEFDARVATEARAVRKAYPLMTAEQVQALAAERVRRELRETLPLATFEEFSRNPQESLF